MNTDKLVFGIIGLVTVAVFVFIIATSFTQGGSPANAQEVIGENPNVYGNENAQITIVEFSDFECPACNSFSSIVKGIADTYPEDVNVVYRHYPLPSHPLAIPAAKAAEAAANQGRFWDYHDELFINQPDFSDEDLVRYAETIGLDIEQFNNDRNSEEIAERVKVDNDYARNAQLSGTPSFFIVYNDEVEAVVIRNYGDLEARVVQILGGNGEGMDSEVGEGTGDSMVPGEDGTRPGDPVDNTVPEEGMIPGETDGNAGANNGANDNPTPIEMAVILDLVNNQRTDLAPSQVNIVGVEEVNWSDASLGCAEEGMMYAQVITPGYRVTVDAGGETINYHTDQSGENVVLCENPSE